MPVAVWSRLHERLVPISRTTTTAIQAIWGDRNEYLYRAWGSPIWRELKDFIQDRLHLPWDEFNRIPVAGVTNIARLSEMLNAATIAFLIMTGEDEQSDGKFHARMNVIHEAGLFQGRLGFTRAIVLLEEGCEGFSKHSKGWGRFSSPREISGQSSMMFVEY